MPAVTTMTGGSLPTTAAKAPRGPGMLAALLLVVALLAVGCVPTARSAPFKPPVKVSAAPVTKVASLKAQTMAVTAALQSMSGADSYKRYQISFKKVSLPKTDSVRQTVYLQNLAFIAKINSNTKLKYVATCNKFTDSTAAELQKLLGLKRPAPGGRRSLSQLGGAAGESGNGTDFIVRHRSLLQADASSAPDWTMVVPAVKNQGSCGSCWAFASACVTEAAHFINTNEVISLAEKQLVDCNTANGGCDGGWFDQAFDYVKSKGLTASALYPYIAQRDICPSNFPASISKLTSYTPLASNDEDAMLRALTNGPIAVAVTADNNWFSYGGGVFSSDGCSSAINHAVVVVGAGVDSDTNAPFWLIRNSWGADWGEGGYMRIARGGSGSPGMCNIAKYPYQVKSADAPSPGPTPPPDNGCKTSTYTVQADDTLTTVAVKFGIPMSQIMIDNKLDASSTLTGKKLTITCPPAGGNWSAPYGVWPSATLTKVPTVAVCPSGHYAVSFYVKPSQWYTSGAWTGSTWVGTIIMTCSDGSSYTLDAQPGFNPGWADGTTSQPNGFGSIPFHAGWAVDSLFGVGAQSGGEVTFSCPADTIVTGMAGGAIADSYPKGWIANLQFLCKNPFNSQTKVRALRSASFVKVTSGLSCSVYAATANDTWFSVAAIKHVDIVELMRSNPAINRNVKAGDKLFLPPCVNGVLQGTKIGSH